jgi:hypothetical protein
MKKDITTRMTKLKIPALFHSKLLTATVPILQLLAATLEILMNPFSPHLSLQLFFTIQ